VIAARRVAGPVLLGIVLGAALLVGSGAFDAPAPAAQTRISALERLVRCPSCTDLSVAQSNAPSSIAVRDEIVAAVRSGRSDAAIIAAIEARYGASILLVPPAGGPDAVLWAGPVALAVAVAACGAVVVARRRRAR